MNQIPELQKTSSWQALHANIRTDCYVLLAALLLGPPSPALLALVRHLTWDEDLPEKLNRALAALNQAGNHCPEEKIAEQFQRLFVGLGSGELVPYGSWYREKRIQSKTLAVIRADLGRLGIIKQADSFESEDHAGALCESMALLSAPENGVAEIEQAAFFNRHLAPWMVDFFKDMEDAKDAEFYPMVGALGRCFLKTESDYLQNFVTTAEKERQVD